MTLGRTRWLAVALPAALVLSGCSAVDDVLGISPNPAAPADRPALSSARAGAIAERALRQAQRADALQTEQAAATAYTGLALRVAAPTYVVEKVLDPGRDRAGQALQPGGAPSRVIVTAGHAFPRTLLAVATPDGSAAAQLSVLESKDVRSPYRVAARADLLPGAALPATAPNDQGAALLTPAQPGLVTTPLRALEDYARLLETGEQRGTEFADDIVVREMREAAAEQADDVEKVATFTQHHQVQRDSVRAVRTADGGAIVIGAIDRVDRFRVKKGAGTIKPPTAYAALAGGVTKITAKADVTTVQTVVMVLPPAGGAQVQVVGFTELPVAVSAS